MHLKQSMLCLDCDEISLIAIQCPICASRMVVELAKWIPPLNDKPNPNRREELLAEAREMITKMTAMMIDVETGEEPLGVGA